MKEVSKTLTEDQTLSLETTNDFFNCFRPDKARKLLHKTIRAAFGQKDRPDKKDIKDILFLKNELEKLIDAAAILAKSEACNPLLEKMFRKKKALEWTDELDELFCAALNGGFFVSPPDYDVYHSCRGLFKILKACYLIYEEERNVVV